MEVLNADIEYNRSGIQNAGELRRNAADESLGSVTEIQAPAPLNAERDGSLVVITDTRTFGTMAQQDAIAAVADVPAQTIDAAYSQVNLQATIDTLVNKINELLAKARTADHLAP